MGNIKTPQENKILDYVNQGKNSYRENDKSSRKAIRKRKAAVNRDFRREGRNILRSKGLDCEDLETRISEQERIRWKKCSDNRLIEHMSFNNNCELTSELQKEAAHRVKKGKRETYLLTGSFIQSR